MDKNEDNLYSDFSTSQVIYYLIYNVLLLF